MGRNKILVGAGLNTTILPCSSGLRRAIPCQDAHSTCLEVVFTWACLRMDGCHRLKGTRVLGSLNGFAAVGERRSRCASAVV
jgi:hypothetical protein